jgi:hypothetical protein
LAAPLCLADREVPSACLLLGRTFFCASSVFSTPNRFSKTALLYLASRFSYLGALPKASAHTAPPAANVTRRSDGSNWNWSSTKVSMPSWAPSTSRCHSGGLEAESSWASYSE